MKEKSGRNMNLVDFFKMRFGDVNGSRYKKAIKNLADSLAAYSLVCFVL